ncbi:MAG: phosphoribosylamine--glycine ligase [Thermaerobacter sp.]|nr:phosphoribosylamine--glycine ligase [Thermaerobacter sp.]
MRVLVLGHGGREHALAWKIAASPLCTKLYIAPGNPGTADLGENVACDICDTSAVVSLVRDLAIELLVIGPEAPLASGVADAVRYEVPSCFVFGPTKAGARLEWSKAYAKTFMNKYGVPTAGHHTFSSPKDAAFHLENCALPVVVKADGLAAGKGVIIAKTRAQAVAAVGMLPLGQTVVVEEFLVGREASVLVITDGRRCHLLPPVRDYKALLENNLGPNTGGMGAYAPLSDLTARDLSEIKALAERTLAGLVDEGLDYRGIIYLGLMLTEEGVKVLEYNARFGDPECQLLMALLESDLLYYLYHAARGELPIEPPTCSEDCACLVVACGGDYPYSPSQGEVITGLAEAVAAGHLVFQAGTAEAEGHLVANGGRILNVVGRHQEMSRACQEAYQALNYLKFAGMRFRGDIGQEEVLP